MAGKKYSQEPQLTAGGQTPTWIFGLENPGVQSYGMAMNQVFTEILANVTTKQINFTQGSLTVSTPVVNHTATWNAGAITFTGIKSNVTDTASAAASLLLDLQVGSATKFNISKSGGWTSQGNCTLNGGTSSDNLAITKGAGSNNAVSITGDGTGAMVSFITSLGVRNAYWNDTANLFLATALTVSGTTTGSGTSRAITQATSGAGNEAYMLGVWSDIVGPASVIRLANSGSTANRFLSCLDNTGNFLFDVGSGGGLSWGAGNYAALDTTLTRTSAASLRITNTLILGTANSALGTLTLSNLSANTSTSLVSGNAAASRTYVLPVADPTGTQGLVGSLSGSTVTLLFSASVPIGTGTSGQLVLWNGTSTVTGSAQITYAQSAGLGQITLGNSSAGDTAALSLKGDTSQLDFYQAGTYRWEIYNAGSTNLLIRDIVNARNQIALSPGATAASAVTTISSMLTVDSSLTCQRLVSDKAASYPVVAADSFTVFTNTSAVGSITFTLPAAAAGLTYTFVRNTNQSVVIQTVGSDTIQGGASVTSAPGTVTLAAVGSAIVIVGIAANKWYATAVTGLSVFA